MLVNNYITKLLGLQNVLITNIEENYSSLSIYLTTKKSKQNCPYCKSNKSNVHDYRIQKINDMPIYKKKTVLILKKRRYTCSNCGKRFFEKYNFVSRYKHNTNRTYLSILDSLRDGYNCKNIAKQHYVSSNTVFRVLKDISFSDKPKLPEILGIDEFKGNAGGDKYQVQLTDIQNRKTIDILLTRNKLYLQYYFSRYTIQERSKVKCIVIDMWKPYRDLRIYFPNARIIIDRFHYDRQVFWALDNIRKRIQKNYPKEKRKLFKHSKYLFHKHYFDLKIDEKLTLQNMLNHSEELYNAWILKENYYFLHEKKDITKEELLEWMENAKRYGAKEFDTCIKAFKNWFWYILESFGSTYTNAYTEGKHNFIKTLKRTAYGFRNFYNFRKRILLAS